MPTRTIVKREPTLSEEAADLRPKGAAPTSVQATALDPFRVTVSWTLPPCAVGYRIYRAAPKASFVRVFQSDTLPPQPSCGGAPLVTATNSIAVRQGFVLRDASTGAKIGGPPVLSYTATGLVPDTRYGYRVAAIYRDSAPGFSDTVSVTTASSPPLVIAEARAFPAEVDLAWHPVAGASAYRVIRDGVRVAQLTPKDYATGRRIDTSYADRGVTRATPYRYRVEAVFIDGVAPERTTGADVSLRTPWPPIHGFADTHAHQFANLAFGGQMFWGEPFGPIDQALQWCTAVHGPGGTGDLLGNTIADQRVGHLVGGYPQFDGWPSWNTIDHQQMHVDWLRRAHLGGLKLMVMHAVNNEVLCGLANRAPGRTCNDMEAVELQIAGAKALEQAIDAHSGGPGRGWYRIVYTPEQARVAIEKGQLAVVLGIEVDNLFGCRLNGPCTTATMRDSLRKYHALGVRHLHPIHFADNAFGGFSYQGDIMNFNNKVLTGNYAQPYDCRSAGYDFRLGGIPGLTFITAALSVIPSPQIVGSNLSYGVFAPPAYPQEWAHCNPTGLTALGESLINEMMSLGMMIDIDHMSARATDRTFAITSSRNYPLVAGHTSLVGTNTSGHRSEGAKTAQQVGVLRAHGGLVSLILHQDATVSYTPSWRGPVANDCKESTKTWAQAYLHAVDLLGGPSLAAVGLASDQGFNKMIAPRCNQPNGVVYPIDGSLPHSTTGTRTFDFNKDGLAHIGMLPDFVADLKRIGLTQQDLAPLFRSAEAYIQMWERATAAATTP